MVTFSIIIPTLNEEFFLPKLLTSLSEQTDQDFEIIVVDGNSTDKTRDVVKRFEKQFASRLRLTVVTSPSVCKQRNRGAGVAKGDYFIFVDADGILLPQAIERFKGFIAKEHPEYITPRFLPDTDKVSDAMVVFSMNVTIEMSIIFRRPLALGQFCIISRKIFAAIGGYNEQLSFGEDQDISERIYVQGSMLRILREALVIHSLRRHRKMGTLKVLWLNARLAVQVVLTKKTPSSIPWYIMGGQLYNDDTQITKKK